MIMVYVCCEDKAVMNSSLEALTLAYELSDGDVTAVLIGEFDENTENTCKEYGAKRIIEVANNAYNIQSYGKILEKIILKYSPSLVLSGSDFKSRDILGFTSARLNAICLSQVNSINIGDDMEFTIAMYGGAILKDVTINDDKVKLALLSNGAFKKEKHKADNTDIIKENIKSDDLNTIIKEVMKQVAEDVNIEDAEKIVVCGKGMDTDEGFLLVEELAKSIGAQIGATRPVTESKRVPKNKQIGQSGKVVAPKLYIGCGVSGATQHVSGILKSDYIVAINKDEDAPIFDVADIGIVGDANAVIPVLIDEIKKIK